MGVPSLRASVTGRILSNPSVDYVATFLCKDGFMRMISGKFNEIAALSLAMTSGGRWGFIGIASVRRRTPNMKN